MTTSGADIQVDDGEFARVHVAILEKLALARLSGGEYRILLFLFRKTYGWNKKEDRISLQQWAEGTKTGRPHVLAILNELIRKRVIYRRDDGGQVPVYGYNKYFEQWLEVFEKDSGRVARFAKAEQVLPEQGTDNKEEVLSAQVTPTEPEPPQAPAQLLPEQGTVTTPGNEPSVTKAGNTSVTLAGNESVTLAGTHNIQQTKKDNIAPSRKNGHGNPSKKHERTAEEQAEVERQKAIMAAYRERVGYPLMSEGQENLAAKKLAQAGYTPEQVTECYTSLKADSFWKAKHLSLQSVAKQIGAFVFKQVEQPVEVYR